MRVTPKTEQEISEENLLAPGIYDFEIINASDEISKSSGSEMIKLQVKIFDHNGDPRCVVFDYLLDAIAYKVRHCAEACGVLDRYEDGNLNADDLIHKCGRAKIIIQKDKNGQYPDKNAIRDYLKPLTIEPGQLAVTFGESAIAINPQQTTAVSRASSKPPAMADIDDEIPF
jgi:hypothetical protein